MRKEGWTLQVVERWNPFAKKRIDLFGFIDIVAMRDGEICGVQATSLDNMGARIAKIKAEPRAKTWKKAGGTIQVWGWRKLKSGWEPKIVEM